MVSCRIGLLLARVPVGALFALIICLFALSRIAPDQCLFALLDWWRASGFLMLLLLLMLLLSVIIPR